MHNGRIFSVVWRVCAAILCLIVLLAVGAVWFVNSDGLRRAVERLAPKYLYADVTMSSLEVEGWMNFPELKITADSLCVVPDIPGVKQSDTLLRAKRLVVRFNLKKLTAKRVYIDSIDADMLSLNLREYSDTSNNWSIVPADEIPKKMPDVAVGHLSLSRGSDVRFKSLPRRIDVKYMSEILRLDNMRIDSTMYNIDADARGRGRVSAANTSATFALDAKAKIDSDKPYASVVELKRLSLEGDGIHLHAEATVERALSNNPQVQATAEANTDLANLARICGVADKVGMSGKADVKLSASMDIGRTSRELLHSLSLSGVLSGDSVNVIINKKHNIAAGNVNVDFKFGRGGETMSADVALSALGYTSGPALKASISQLNAQASAAPKGGIDSLRGKNARETAAALNIAGSAGIKGGKLFATAYPAPVEVGALSASFANDVLKVARLDVATQNTSLRVSGTADKLIAGASVAKPMNITGRVDFDTLDLNQMSAVFRRGAGRNSLRPSKVRAGAKGDMRPVSMPKWMNLTASLNIGLLKCINLPLRNFGGRCKMTGGNLHIPELHASTPFAKAGAKVGFFTANPQNINLSVGVDINNFDFTRFLSTFPAIAKKTPDLSLLRAKADVDINARFSTFPTMVINLPSVNAGVTLRGRDITMSQNERIHRFARLLMIKHKGDIRMSDFTANVRVADERVMLLPFTIDVDRYAFGVEGFNDFSSNLYYHADILHSPVPFKFGVNFYGSRGKYKVRFGRAEYKPSEALLNNKIMSDARVNMITELKYYLGLLIDAAAKENNKRQ